MATADLIVDAHAISVVHCVRASDHPIGSYNAIGESTNFHRALRVHRRADGRAPYAGLILDAEGNLYGTTGGGGALRGGTVFKVDTTGRESVLHSFNRKEGIIPRAGLIRDASGSL